MTSLVERFGPIATLTLIVACLPLFLPNVFYIEVAILVALNAIVCVGLNLLFGYAGQISLGHAAFFGLGAYGSALIAKQGVPSLLAILLAVLGVAAFAYLIGRPILRLAGHYLAMATLGVGLVIWTFFSREIGLTGGPDGMAVSPFRIGGLSITTHMAWYWIIGATLVLTVAFAGRLVRSPIGRALRAIRGSEVAAKASGIDVAGYKVFVFTLSAVLASLAGSLYVMFAQFITPAEATFFRSVEFLTMIVLGGLASIYGAVVGAAILTLLPHLFARLHDYEMVVIGAILVLCMVFLPQGLVPTIAKFVRERRR